jgi:hypothetical protein
MPENKNHKINHPEGFTYIAKEINLALNILKNKMIK